MGRGVRGGATVATAPLARPKSHVTVAARMQSTSHAENRKSVVGGEGSLIIPPDVWLSSATTAARCETPRPTVTETRRAEIMFVAGYGYLRHTGATLVCEHLFWNGSSQKEVTSELWTKLFCGASASVIIHYC